MRKTIIYLLIIVSFMACESEPAITDSKATHALDITEYYQKFNEHKWEELALYYSATVDIQNSLLDMESIQMSSVDLVYVLRDLERAYPDISDSVVRVHWDRNTAIVEMVTTGISPVGDSLRLSTCQILECDVDGKIVRDFCYGGG